MVTIKGSGFGSAPSNVTVTFDGAAGPVNSASPSAIEAMVPQTLSGGSAPVEVTVGGRSASGPDFSVEPEAPGISYVAPDSGTVGTEVRIKGMNFSSTASENTITFGGTEARVKGASPDELLTEVPSGASDGPVSVTVGQRSTTGPEFDVITEGTLRVLTATSGKDRDADGYTISVDGGNSQSADPSDTLSYGRLQGGSHQVALSGAAQNCTPGSDNPRSVDVRPGQVTTTSFEVGCDPVASNQIVHVQGFPGSGEQEIVLMNADGSNAQRLTDNLSDDYQPSISNKGTKIAFASARERNFNVYVMDVDGSNVRKVTNSTFDTSEPTWSPDDSKLAFLNDRDGDEEIYTMNIDGSNPTQVTDNSDNEQFPDWSPAGSTIVFQKDVSNNIYTVDVEGGGVTMVTNNSDIDKHPKWSPDGSRIAFASNRDGDYELYTMNADGSGIRQVTSNSATDDSPSWSPDGSELVFLSDRDGGKLELYKINADGSGQATRLTNNSEDDFFPHWSPVQ